MRKTTQDSVELREKRYAPSKQYIYCWGKYSIRRGDTGGFEGVLPQRQRGQHKQAGGATKKSPVIWTHHTKHRDGVLTCHE